jgi:hypothetical protein
MISHILYRYGITEITKFTRRFNFMNIRLMIQVLLKNEVNKEAQQPY